MHKEALESMQYYYNKYMNKIESGTVLDVGSQDINGTPKPVFKDWNYIGLDMELGENVDYLIGKNNTFPFNDNVFDVSIAISVFEHDPLFWLTIKEMARVTKHQGFIYISAPSTGSVHRYPMDCWRFYPDCWKALMRWEPSLFIVEKNINIKSLRKDNNCLFKVLK